MFDPVESQATQGGQHVEADHWDDTDRPAARGFSFDDVQFDDIIFADEE